MTGVSRSLADGSVAPEMLAAPIAAQRAVTLSAPTLAIGLAVDKTSAATGSVVNYIVTVSNKGKRCGDKVGGNGQPARLPTCSLGTLRQKVPAG